MTRAQTFRRRQARRPRMIAQALGFSVGSSVLWLAVYACIAEPGPASVTQPAAFAAFTAGLLAAAIASGVVAIVSLYEACA